MIDFIAQALASFVAAALVLGVFLGIPAYYLAKAIYKIRKYGGGK